MLIRACTPWHVPIPIFRFDPKLIMFENHAGKRIQPWLEDHGYYVCCCFNHNGNNIVAVKQ